MYSITCYINIICRSLYFSKTSGEWIKRAYVNETGAEPAESLVESENRASASSELPPLSNEDDSVYYVLPQLSNDDSVLDSVSTCIILP